MALWRTYYHVVWTTKERLPLISPDIETALYGYLIGKADALETIVHAIGGVQDHIHLVGSVPPKLSIAKWVQTLKGSSSHYINHELTHGLDAFRWQRGYGVFSLGRKQLDTAVAYVRNQKTHHADGTVLAALEQCSHEDIGPPAWRRGAVTGGVPGMPTDASE
jgi:putative transposase